MTTLTLDAAALQQQRAGALHVRGEPARLDVRVLLQRRRVGAVHLAGRVLHGRGRHARVPGPRDQPRARHRGPAGRLRVGGRARPRRDAAEHADPHRAARGHAGADRGVHVRGHGQPPRRPDLPVRARRRAVVAVRLGGIEYVDLTRRVHTLLVRARDAWGNWDPTPASWTWNVKAPPVTTILSGPAPDEITESTSATFTFAASTPGSTFWCWLDGVLDQDCIVAEDATRASPAARTSSPSSRGIRTGSGSSSGPSTSGRSASSTRRSR